MPNKLQEVLLKHNQQVPRYTSYPTAPHFKSDVGEKQVSGWLTGTPKEDTVSLYFHIPFCKNMCWYCGCNTKATQHYKPVAEYLIYLKKEISLIAEKHSQKLSVSHIHFGGGSPSYVRPDDFRDLMKHVRSKFNVLDGAEIAIELDPREITEPKVAAYGQQGVNRASLGVQDFHYNVQEAINRVQPFGRIYQTVELLRAYNIKAISFDLLYGLPHQTASLIEKNIALAAILNPSRISLFGYAHVPWMKKHMQLIEENSLPDSAARLEQFNVARMNLKRKGYIEIGLDHFALPNDPMTKAYKKKKLHRNFQGYTTDRATTLIGFGASAISAYAGGYAQNMPDTRSYYASIDKDQMPIIKGRILNDEDLLRRSIIEYIMCYNSVDLASVIASSDIETNTFDHELAKLQTLKADGLIDIQGTKITVHPDAIQATRLVAAVFDTYLAPSPKKHAQVA